MKKIALSAMLFPIGLLGCARTEVIDPTGETYAWGTIIRKVGDYGCRITVKTGRYGVHTTRLLEPEECEKYQERMEVRVELRNGNMEILGILP